MTDYVYLDGAKYLPSDDEVKKLQAGRMRLEAAGEGGRDPPRARSALRGAPARVRAHRSEAEEHQRIRLWPGLPACP